MTQSLLFRNNTISRRALLRGSAAALGAAAFGPIGCAVAPRQGFADDPFRLGVASGDPLPDSVILWTRLAPRPLDMDGGMDDAPVTVRWQVAHDEAFTRLVREGAATARAENAHAVHVDVAGLEPRRGYFYRFIAGAAASPVGRTRTAPAPGGDPGVVRLGHVGCQNYEHGYYTAYRRLAKEELDLVLHTGDYIYEGAGRPAAQRKKARDIVRYHPMHVCRTLEQYRLRYAVYKSDEDLQAAHVAHPFAVVFDDHELGDNWAGLQNKHGQGGGMFMAQRAAAFKAWWEHMPVRLPRPMGDTWPAYRGLELGNLVRLNLCDTRQYRTLQPCGGRTEVMCDGAMTTRAEMLGVTQESWLRQRFASSSAGWNVMVQQVLMGALDRDGDPQLRRFDMDKWDGYQLPRKRLLGFLAEARIANPVVLTGDIHTHMAVDLRVDFERPETPVVANEFVNTSISSNGDGSRRSKARAAWVRDNPHVKYALGQRGYVRHAVTAAAWRADFRVLDYVTRKGAPARTDRSFTIESGRRELLT